MSSRCSCSVPADLPDRLYLRIFDPEPAGAHDTRYGRSRTPTSMLFRLSGGEGALTGAPLPAAVADGARPGAPAAAAAPRRRPRDRRAALRRGGRHRRRLGDAGAVQRRRRRARSTAAPGSGST